MTRDFWRVAVVEDHLLQRRATVSLINQQDGLRVVFDAATLPEFVRWFGRASSATRPHLLVLDLLVERGPSASPVVVRRLINHGVRVLVFSALSSPTLAQQVLRAGAAGVVDKRDSEEDLVAALWAVLRGDRWTTADLERILAGDPRRPALSDQEERALVLYASGKTLDAVAAAMGVKAETAKTYVRRVKAKYAAAGRPVRTKVDLVRVAVADGYLKH